MRGKRRGHNPLVVRLMQVLINQWMVQTSVDEVNQGVGEDEEAGELQELVPQAWAVGGCIIQLRVSTDLEEPEDGRKQSHAGERRNRLLDLHGYLILQILRVSLGALIEYEPV